MTRYDEIDEDYCDGDDGDGVGYDDDDDDDDDGGFLAIHSFSCRRLHNHVIWFDLEVISFSSCCHVTPPPPCLFGGHEVEKKGKQEKK